MLVRSAGSVSEKDRAVDLAPELRDLLTAHLSSLPGGDPDSLVFRNLAGGPIHQVAWLRNHFKPAVKKALPIAPDREILLTSDRGNSPPLTSLSR